MRLALPEELEMCGAEGLPRSPEPDESPSGMRWNRDEIMKPTNTNSYQN